jgi:hypothetical protein
MFKGACRLDDPAHRTIIFIRPFRVKKFPQFCRVFQSMSAARLETSSWEADNSYEYR